MAACRPSLEVKSGVAKLPVQRVRTKLLASRSRPVTSPCSAGMRRTSQYFLRGDRDISAFCQVDCSFARLEVDDIKASVPRLKSQQRHGHSRKLPAFVQQRHPGETRERARLQAGRRHQQSNTSFLIATALPDENRRRSTPRDSRALQAIPTEQKWRLARDRSRPLASVSERRSFKLAWERAAQNERHSLHRYVATSRLL